jgi:hypothetical protein
MIRNEPEGLNHGEKEREPIPAGFEKAVKTIANRMDLFHLLVDAIREAGRDTQNLKAATANEPWKG